MPHINELRESKFLKKEDCGNGILVTIKECFQENVAKEGAPQELKWCLSFEEVEKPLVLNSTNAQVIAKITGADDTDAWPGMKVVLYNDPNVSYAGKIIGGIRARAPRTAAKPAAPTQRPVVPRPPADTDLDAQPDDIPF